MPRLDRILHDGERRAFDPFDRFAGAEASKNKSLDELLDEFMRLREASLQRLRALALERSGLARRGRHPAFGTVTVRELLATRVVHDLGHLAQIVRVMSKRYAGEVGSWKAYLAVLTR